MCFSRISGISTYHSVDFRDNGSIRFWRYHGIGRGKTFPIKFQEYAVETIYKVEKGFPSAFPRGKSKTSRKAKENNNFYDCPEIECTETFDSIELLEDHILDGKHKLITVTSTVDKTRLCFVRRMQTEQDSSGTHHIQIMNQHLPNVQSRYKKIGWALQKRKPPQRLSEKQKKYIEVAFKKGEQTGRKVTSEALAVSMKIAVDSDGQKSFRPAEYLTPLQIMAQFSRLKSKKHLDDEDEIAWEERNSVRKRRSVRTKNLYNDIISDFD
jgi:hypothetical protein